MPPDIALDMYDSDPEDKDDEWVAWLAGLNQTGGEYWYIQDVIYL